MTALTILLAQVVETEIAAKVIEAMKEHQGKGGGGLDSFMFLCALVLMLIGGFAAVRWIITFNQKSICEITADHKASSERICVAFETGTKAQQSMVHDARDITLTAVATNMSAQETLEALRKSREERQG